MSKSITNSYREKIRYQLRKLEYLTKRKAGQYVFFDTKNNRLINSGEDNNLNSKLKIKSQANPEEVIAFLKSLNNYLERKEKLNARRSVLALFS